MKAADRPYVIGDGVFDYIDGDLVQVASCIYWLPKPKHHTADYPPPLANAVAAVNCMSEYAVFAPIARGHADPMHLLGTLDRVYAAKAALDLWRKTEGYTKSWSCNDYGFVRYEESA